MCKYCEHENNDFVTLNTTVDYSNIEMSLNRHLEQLLPFKKLGCLTVEL